MQNWSEEDKERERLYGEGPLDERKTGLWTHTRKRLGRKAGLSEEDLERRHGDERLTFVYGL